MTQEKFDGTARTYFVKASAPNNDPVWNQITLTEAPCDVKSLTVEEADKVYIMEVPKGEDKVALSKIPVSAMFTNSE